MLDMSHPVTREVGFLRHTELLELSLDLLNRSGKLDFYIKLAIFVTCCRSHPSQLRESSPRETMS